MMELQVVVLLLVEVVHIGASSLVALFVLGIEVFFSITLLFVVFCVSVSLELVNFVSVSIFALGDSIDSFCSSAAAETGEPGLLELTLLAFGEFVTFLGKYDCF
uniref:Uncharacterized protein n=1 Tax=Panstrongylus lignarius TaxID=156445 RepID=A0A224Y1B2_9HEMI